MFLSPHLKIYVHINLKNIMEQAVENLEKQVLKKTNIIMKNNSSPLFSDAKSRSKVGQFGSSGRKYRK